MFYFTLSTRTLSRGRGFGRGCGVDLDINGQKGSRYLYLLLVAGLSAAEHRLSVEPVEEATFQSPPCTVVSHTAPFPSLLL